jgi:signal transduction histidine kinase
MLRTDPASGGLPGRTARPPLRGPAPLATVAHDLRQPTAAALLTADFIDELLDAHAPAEMLRRQTALIRRSMQHALRLTHDLLFAEQVEAGALRLGREPTAVAALLEEAVLLVAPHARAKHIDVRVSTPGPLPAADADPHRILQVLVNVAANAIQFTPPRGCLQLSAAFDDGVVRVDVTDSGPGMTEDRLARLFERFWHADPRGTSNGFGLGLAIARRIVDLHGGVITAANVPGGGLRVSFTLPTCDAAPPRPSPDGATAGAGPAEAPLRG